MLPFLFLFTLTSNNVDVYTTVHASTGGGAPSDRGSKSSLALKTTVCHLSLVTERVFNVASRSSR